MMPAKNRVELKQYIRFQLSQMSARNDQHLWEHAAFELARQKISPNLLPATGPVQAGGDQGRDFESYRSYLGSAFGDRAWTGKGAQEILAFACTLNKKLPAKIKADLATIFGGGQRPDAVYYFAEPDLPVASRHDLQEYCRTTHGARLEVFDGQAVADMLADPDAFWIAEQYFSVPSEMFPPVETDEQYASLKARWLGPERDIGSVADFMEIKRGLRASYKGKEHIVDLGRWIAQMRRFAQPGESRFERRALYEITVAQLRGRGTLDPETSTVERFFSSLPPTPTTDELQDAAIATSYCTSARRLGQFSVLESTLTGWRATVAAAIDAALQITSQHSPSRYSLLLSRAHLAALDRENSDRAIEAIFEDWSAALEIAKENPLCNVSDIGSMLEALVPVAGTKPEFAQIADQLDALTASRDGAAAAAERSRDRAMAHYRAGQLLPAIDQLQRAKEGWFAAETIRGSILAMLVLSHAYGELHLPWAARFYASAAQYVAIRASGDEQKPYAARAAFEIADTFFQAGEALSFLAALNTALTLHAAFEADPGDLEEHQHFTRALAQATTLRAGLKIIRPDLLPIADGIIQSFPLDEEFIEEIISASEGSPWSEKTTAELHRQLADEMGQPLTNDLGPQAQLRWRALGLHWIITSTAADRLLSEQLAAALQIVLADIADLELLIIPSDVDIALSRGSGVYPRVAAVPGNNGRRWEIALPKSFEDDAQGQIETTLTVIMTVLTDATALPPTEFRQLIDTRMKRGLLNRAFWVRPAAELLGEARDAAAVDQNLEDVSADPDPPPEPLEAEALAWRDSVAPNYSWEAAQEFLHNRYRRMSAFGKAYAARIMANADTAALLRRLHDDGSKDWQILLTLMNIAIQNEVEAKIGPMTGLNVEAAKSATFNALKAVESGILDNFDPAVFTEENINVHSKIQVSAAMQTWNLSINSPTPDLEALKRLLDVRFRQAVDDIEHDDFFNWNENLAEDAEIRS